MDRQHNDQKEEGYKDKQRSTSITYQTKDQVTRSPLTTVYLNYALYYVSKLNSIVCILYHIFDKICLH
jgi:hypothetical protein